MGGGFSSFNGAAAGSLVKLYGDPARPAVVNPPANTGVPPGATATFGVGAFGTGLTYQWLKDGTPLADGGDISGATTSILSIANADLSDESRLLRPGHRRQPVHHRHQLLRPPLHPRRARHRHRPRRRGHASPAPPSPSPPRSSPPHPPPTSGPGTASPSSTTPVSAEPLPPPSSFASTVAADTGTYALTVSNAQGSASTSLYALVRPVPSARVATFSGLTSASAVRSPHPLPDGRMLVAVDGGTMSNGASTSAGAAMHLVNADGTVANLGTDPLTAAKLPYVGGQILATFVQPDGKILIGGTFTTVNGVTRNRVARLLPDGSLDTAFDPGIGPNNNVNTLALDASGRVLVGGAFTSFNGSTSYRLRRPPQRHHRCPRHHLDPGHRQRRGHQNPPPPLRRLPDRRLLLLPQTFLARFDDTGARVTTY